MISKLYSNFTKITKSLVGESGSKKMTEQKAVRLRKAASEFNVGTSTITEMLSKKGYDVENKPNTKLTPEMYAVVVKEFESEKSVKEEAAKKDIGYKKQTIVLNEDGEVQEQTKVVEKEETPIVEKETPAIEEKTVEEKAVEEKTVEVEETPVQEEKTEPVKEEVPEKETPVKQTAVEEIKVTAESEKIEKPEKKITEETAEPKEETVVVEKEVKKEDKPLSETQKPVSKENKKVETPPQPQAVAEKKSEQEENNEDGLKVLGKIDLTTINTKTKPDKKTREEKQKERSAREKQRKEEQRKRADEHKKKQAKEKQKAESEKVKKKVDAKQKANNQKNTVKPQQQAKGQEPVSKKEADQQPDNFLKTKIQKLEGPTILGKIELETPKKNTKKKPVASSNDKTETTKKKRKRIRKPGNKPVNANQGDNNKQRQKNDNQRANNDRRNNKKKVAKVLKAEPSEEEIQKQIKDTLARLSSGGKSKGSAHRRSKRDQQREQRAEQLRKSQEEQGILKVTEFVTVSELATMMDVPVNKIIATCMTLGVIVSINQRLDAETINILAEEFGYKTEFVSVEVAEAISEIETVDAEEDLEPRSPIVTVMGHVDHGKTSLLDYIRNANVIAGEAGGITQHIGAYEVRNDEGKRITFLDTPGHEAFTAMRARGAKITDVAIIVIAADDTVMPQTVEAINHAQAANVPIVFAINKIDRPTANPDKIKEELSKINILVEDWGGKYQSQEISAKQGVGIDDLLEKVLLEAELLDLKGNPNRPATGTILESSLDKGRGYVAKLLVQNGSMKIGDMVLAGSNFGKVKAMYNERNKQIKEAGPSTPVLLLGLNGAPQAGDNFNIMVDEKEAKQIANKRMQLQREQGLRTQKHITLDEIGRRIAIGDFKELNIIVKGDMDGSVEALADSMLKLSTEEVQVNVIHKSVGQVTETDVMLASASDAIIVGFQVRPSVSARKLAENEQIDIRTYSVIYKAIEEIKAAIEGMLSPDIEEKILCNIEIRETFKISKVGTIAGCMVLDGSITRNTKIRLIRDGIVIYTGSLGSLKRFKDDVKEVKAGFECGLNIENFNDIKVGDIVEGYEHIEVARKLS